MQKSQLSEYDIHSLEIRISLLESKLAKLTSLVNLLSVKLRNINKVVVSKSASSVKERLHATIDSLREIVGNIQIKPGKRNSFSRKSKTLFTCENDLLNEPSAILSAKSISLLAFVYAAKDAKTALELYKAYILQCRVVFYLHDMNHAIKMCDRISKSLMTGGYEFKGRKVTRKDKAFAELQMQNFAPECMLGLISDSDKSVIHKITLASGANETQGNSIWQRLKTRPFQWD